MRPFFLTTTVVFLCSTQLTNAQLYSPVENPETPNVFAAQFIPLDEYESCDGPGESAYHVKLQADNFNFTLGANDNSGRLFFVDGAPSFTQSGQFICSRIERKGVEAIRVEIPCGDEPPRPQSPLNELKANFSAELTICQSLGSFQVLDNHWTIETERM